MIDLKSDRSEELQFSMIYRYSKYHGLLSDVTAPVVSGVLLGSAVVTIPFIVVVVVICLRLRWYRKRHLEM